MDKKYTKHEVDEMAEMISKDFRINDEDPEAVLRAFAARILELKTDLKVEEAAYARLEQKYEQDLDEARGMY